MRIDSKHAEAHNNLGAMLYVAGQVDEAAAHYRRAVELRPENAEAHSNLGRLLTIQGQHRPAAAEFNRALAINPDNPSFLFGLAWVRAAAPDADVRDSAEAIRVATRAVELSGHKDPAALDVLGVAYASAGDFDRAVEAAQDAMRLADAVGLPALWVEIRERLRLYQRSLPYLLR